MRVFLGQNCLARCFQNILSLWGRDLYGLKSLTEKSSLQIDRNPLGLKEEMSTWAQTKDLITDAHELVHRI